MVQPVCLLSRNRLTASHNQLLAVVSRRWIETEGSSTADLAILILHELAESYRPAVYDLFSWLDDWELGLYGKERVDRTALIELWNAAAILRSWVKPLNPPGMRADLDKSWFGSAARPQLVREADDRIDKALAELRKLSDTLRAAFGVAQFQLADEEQRSRERFQRWVALITAAFAGPTIVTALFGARATPFGDTWTSFAAIVAITFVSVVVIWVLITLLSRRDTNVERGR